MTFLRRFALMASCVAFSFAQPPKPAMAQAQSDMVPLIQGQILRGRFEQIRELKGFDAPMKSTGSFAVSPGKGLLWRTEKPYSIIMAMSEGGFLQEVNGKETMQASASKLPFAAQLYKMLGGALLGDYKALSGVFEITQSKEAGGWRVVMIPRKLDDPNMPMKSITIVGKRHVESVSMVKANGDSERLQMLDQKLSTGALQADEDALLARAGKL